MNPLLLLAVILAWDESDKSISQNDGVAIRQDVAAIARQAAGNDVGVRFRGLNLLLRGVGENGDVSVEHGYARDSVPVWLTYKETKKLERTTCRVQIIHEENIGWRVKSVRIGGQRIYRRPQDFEKQGSKDEAERKELVAQRFDRKCVVSLSIESLHRETFRDNVESEALRYQRAFRSPERAWRSLKNMYTLEAPYWRSWQYQVRWKGILAVLKGLF